MSFKFESGYEPVQMTPEERERSARRERVVDVGERTLSEETVRDLFAMVALQSLMASGYDRTSDPRMAYTIADAMMEARKR